jgi:hypothetical protein
MADQQERADPPLRDPRPSYYVHNPWRSRATGAFAGASSMLTITAVFYALGRLPLPLVGISVLLAAAAFGFGLYARRRAARFDAEVGGP